MEKLTQEKLKLKAIKAAYGNYYESCNPNENGWTKWYDTARFSDLEFNVKDNLMRPLVLKGIENNNGWTLIESEADLPKSNCFLECVCKGNKLQATHHFIIGNEKYVLQYYSHYKLIPFNKPNF